MNMIEKVAMAIDNTSIIKHSETIEEWRIRRAKAAIEAMREPTVPMVQAMLGYIATTNHPAYQEELVSWQEAIDAALKEE